MSPIAVVALQEILSHDDLMREVPTFLKLDYRILRRDHVTCLVRNSWANDLGDIFFKSTNACPSSTFPGRGMVEILELETGKAVYRKYLRGGLMRFLTHDRYFLANRPLQELRILEHLYLHGFPSPEPLGICWERNGLLTRGAIIMRFLPGENLLNLLRRGEQISTETFFQIGSVIHWMHSLDIFHADLHVGNILVADQQVWLVDFDKARMCTNISEFLRIRNLHRLMRSFKKHRIPETLFQQVLTGYGYPETMPRIAGFHSYWKQLSGNWNALRKEKQQ